ncbi:tubulin beta chain 4 [Perilla frutescens var. frutescens]|nr:tubulin beta chain 4 [Perilla frutescens var. frutescens]
MILVLIPFLIQISALGINGRKGRDTEVAELIEYVLEVVRNGVENSDCLQAPILKTLGQDECIAEMVGPIALVFFSINAHLSTNVPGLDLLYITTLVLLIGNMENVKVAVDIVSICLNKQWLGSYDLLRFTDLQVFVPLTSQGGEMLEQQNS